MHFAYPQLLFEDLRIPAIDFPIRRHLLTMFPSLWNSSGPAENTAAQAMLQNVSREELLPISSKASINIPGVDAIPASLTMHSLLKAGRDCVEETFASWQNIHAVLKENIIDKLRYDYDWFFLDMVHLDALQHPSERQTDVDPLPPATVDFHSP